MEMTLNVIIPSAEEDVGPSGVVITFDPDHSSKHNKSQAFAEH
ncbi:MAG: hypothetical protein Q8868_14150 [Bacteroidota bacterium]|nr:hypothetical protein [Bacteroidota bacterium]